MKAQCFACPVFVEGADADAVAAAFIAHGQTIHAWSYPEQALRNYAVNYAEAIDRVGTDTERRPEIGDVTVHAMAEGRVDDWLGLFDRDGFAGNPGWAACYCLEPHLPAPPEMPERAWRETRATMAERLRDGSTFGYLAYADGKAIGWVNASRRSEYRLYQINGGPEPESVVGVSCFVVAPAYRRHGVAAALLDRVIADAAGRGASWVEGYPHNEPERTDAGHFRGPRSMYDERGFEVAEVLDRYTVMRRPA